MTTLKAWTDMSISVLQNSLDIVKEWHRLDEGNLVLSQAQVLKKQVISFIDFLERIKAEHEQNHHPSQPDTGQRDGVLGGDPEMAHGSHGIPDKGPSGL